MQRQSMRAIIERVQYLDGNWDIQGYGDVDDEIDHEIDCVSGNRIDDGIDDVLGKGPVASQACPVLDYL